MAFSHGRGEAHARSDWDFAYEADATFAPDGLLASLADRLKADRIDLVDLDRARRLCRILTLAAPRLDAGP
jgi:hypothetical protein